MSEASRACRIMKDKRTAELRGLFRALPASITPDDADRMATRDMAKRLPADLDVADECAVDRALADMGIEEPIRTVARIEAVQDAYRRIRARDAALTFASLVFLIFGWLAVWIATPDDQPRAAQHEVIVQ